MQMTHEVQLPYTDSLKKKLRMDANLQWIHLLFNQTPNTFYETKELFKYSKGHFPNGEEYVHPILGLLQVNKELYRSTKPGKPQRNSSS